MNIRLEDQQIRFRVSEGEFGTLCSGQAVEQQTYLPGRRLLKVSVRPCDGDSMHLDCEDDHIALYLGLEKAEAFRAILPGRAGLEGVQLVNGERTLSLILEVDVRSQKKKRDQPQH